MSIEDHRIRRIFPVAVLALCVAAGCRTADAGRQAPPEAPVPPAERPAAEKVYSNTVKWRTASEVDNFGYDVYRSESPNGPFERINPEVIEGAGTSDEIHAYRYVDDTVDPYKTYYYYVESISMSGVRERFTPIGEAPAKLPAEKED